MQKELDFKNYHEHPPDLDKIKKNYNKINTLLFNKNVILYFVPSANLRYLIAKGEHPHVQGMPDGFKSLLLEGKAVLIQKLMVQRWLTGELDKKNSFILANGDIRVVNENIKLIS